MTQQDEIRKQVSQAYTQALQRAKQGGSGCCGPSACVEPAGSAARTAGYGTELAAHTEAGQSSFGCGNPLALAGVERGQTVLDLGSGAGLDLLIAAEKAGPTGRVIGVDMTDDMLAEARANAARAGYDNVELRKGLIEDLPVESGTIDWVISNCVVNLSPQKPLVFAEIERVLRPGGRFSISDIVADELPPAILENPAAYAACIAGAISEADYVAGLEAAGLVDVQVSERLVYDADQLSDLVGSDLEWAGLEPHAFEGAIADAAGTVVSVRVSGRKA